MLTTGGRKYLPASGTFISRWKFEPCPLNMGAMIPDAGYRMEHGTWNMLLRVGGISFHVM
jgi:hypothetical protein